ncbi:hypothetical protein ACJX0J_001294 (mitochondrion) [Zea mays]
MKLPFIFSIRIGFLLLHWNRESFFFILYISMREELPLLRIPGKDRVYQQWKFSKNSNPNVFLSYMYRVIFTGKEDKEEATTYMIEQAVGFHHHLIDIDIYLGERAQKGQLTEKREMRN